MCCFAPLLPAGGSNDPDPSPTDGTEYVCPVDLKKRTVEELGERQGAIFDAHLGLLDDVAGEDQLVGEEPVLERQTWNPPAALALRR